MKCVSSKDSGTSQDAGGPAYAGDVSVEKAWEMLKSDPNCLLVDTRTQSEWAYVGVPDLSELGKDPILIEWQSFPTMQVNETFTDQLAEIVAEKKLPKTAPILFICRSGARSRSAAIASTAAGHPASYNVDHGVEGDLDERFHRNSVNGWKFSGLPWKQS